MAKGPRPTPQVEMDIQIERWPIERLIPRANNPRRRRPTSRRRTAKPAVNRKAGIDKPPGWATDRPDLVRHPGWKDHERIVLRFDVYKLRRFTCECVEPQFSAREASRFRIEIIDAGDHALRALIERRFTGKSIDLPMVKSAIAVRYKLDLGCGQLEFVDPQRHNKFGDRSSKALFDVMPETTQFPDTNGFSLS